MAEISLRARDRVIVVSLGRQSAEVGAWPTVKSTSQLLTRS